VLQSRRSSLEREPVSSQWVGHGSSSSRASSQTYGVDLFLGGHQHNYNRLYAVGAKGTPHPECMINATATMPSIYLPCDNRTITIITGSPGCSGAIDTVNAPADAVVVAIDAYGYGRLQIVNATTAHYWWLETVASGTNGRLVRVAADAAQTDEAWIVRATS
jgi:hypothetical protein